jgi:hypothetical protein
MAESLSVSSLLALAYAAEVGLAELVRRYENGVA